MFLDNFCCCATADAVQEILRVVVHELHPDCDPQVFLLEHKSFHIRERLRNKTTKLLGDILLRLGAETRENMNRDLHPHREKAMHARKLRRKCLGRSTEFQISTRFLWHLPR